MCASAHAREGLKCVEPLPLSRMSSASDLGEIFESVTGTDEITDEQDCDAANSADGDASETGEDFDLQSVRNDLLADAADDMDGGTR